MTTAVILVNSTKTENALAPLFVLADSAITADILNVPADAQSVRLAFTNNGNKIKQAYQCDCGKWRVIIDAADLEGITDTTYALWCEDATNRSYCLGLGQLISRREAQ